jgi:phosphoheptose isomerase
VGDAEDLLKDSQESSRARELLVRREAAAISTAAGLVASALGAQGRTLYLVGAGELGLIARAAAHAFVAGEAGAPLRAISLLSEVALGAPPTPDHPLVREVRAFVDRGDVLLAMAREGTPGPVILALDAARAKGASAVVVTGYPGEGFTGHADALVVIPSRRPTVIAETALSVGHALARLVARRLGNETATRKDPFDSAHEEKDLLGSSDEAVVAELVAPAAQTKGAPAAVELVPLYVVDGNAGAPPPNTVRFKCKNCGELITVDAKFAGRSGQCPQCLNDFVIPGSLEAIPSPAVPSVARTPQASPAGSGARRASPGSSAGPVPGRQKPTPAPVSRPEAAGAAGGPHAAAGPQEERRRARRVTVKDALISFGRGAFDDDPQPDSRHTLDDLSLTGLSFTVKGAKNGAPARVGEPLFVLLDFPAFVDRIKIQGEVRRVEPLEDRSGYTVGVRFSKFLDDAQAKVRRLVENDALRGVRRR